MSLTDKIAEKLAGAFGWLILRELRRVASAIEKSCDSYREIHGFQPLFKSPPEIANAVIADEQREAAELLESPEGSAAEGDFLRLEILELLAGEQNVAIDPTTDLIALGKERGWLDQAGAVVMLPKGFGE